MFSVSGTFAGTIRRVSRFSNNSANSSTARTALPDAREAFIGEGLAVVREVSGGNVDGDLAIGDLLVRVLGMRESVAVADHDRFNLERT